MIFDLIFHIAKNKLFLSFPRILLDLQKTCQHFQVPPRIKQTNIGSQFYTVLHYTSEVMLRWLWRQKSKQYTGAIPVTILFCGSSQASKQKSKLQFVQNKRPAAQPSQHWLLFKKGLQPRKTVRKIINHIFSNKKRGIFATYNKRYNVHSAFSTNCCFILLFRKVVGPA